MQGLLRRGAGGLQQGGRDRVLRKIRLRLGPALIPERRPGFVVVYHHVRQLLREDGPQVRGVGGRLLIVRDLPAAVLPGEGDGGGELAVGAALPAGGGALIGAVPHQEVYRADATVLNSVQHPVSFCGEVILMGGGVYPMVQNRRLNVRLRGPGGAGVRGGGAHIAPVGIRAVRVGGDAVAGEEVLQHRLGLVPQQLILGHAGGILHQELHVRRGGEEIDVGVVRADHIAGSPQDLRPVGVPIGGQELGPGEGTDIPDQTGVGVRFVGQTLVDDKPRHGFSGPDGIPGGDHRHVRPARRHPQREAAGLIDRAVPLGLAGQERLPLRLR